MYLCLSGESVAGDGPLLEAITGPLSGRVIFGSGYPFADPEEGVAAWSGLGLPDATLRSVLYDNAADLMEPAPAA